MNKSKKGISLIVLVVTIVVIIILVATVLYNITDGKIFGVANESVFKNDLRVIEEEFEMFVQTKATQSVGKFEIESLNAADNGLTYNTKTDDRETNIYDVIPTAKKGYYSEFEIIKGELYYKGDVEQKLIWAKELGIGIIPYEIIDGVLISANSNLLLLDSTGTVRIPYNVTKIGDGAFNNLEGLTRVIIPGSVKEIGSNAFSSNTSLQEVIMEDGVEIIGSYAFRGCSNLKSVKMVNSVKIIYEQAFYGCSSLSNIELSNSVSYIGSYTFGGCRLLSIINLPENLSYLGGYCFIDCSSLKKVNIPNGLTTLENGMFLRCSMLSDIEISSENKNFVFENGKLYNNSKTKLYFVTNEGADKNLSELTIEEGIKEISNGALNFYTNVKVLNLPSTIEDINKNYITSKIEKINVSENNTKFSSDGINIYNKSGEELILSISKNKTITIKNGVKSIGYKAFGGCNNLSEIILNDDLERIGEQAFANTSLKEINIPASVKNIDPIAFYLLNMERIDVDENNMYYSSDEDFIYNKDKTKIILYYRNENNVNIKEGVEVIGYNAFHGKKLTNIIFPNTLVELSNRAFAYCNSLTGINISNNVKKIGTNCFEFCNSLSSINIDNTKNSISGAPWSCPYGMRVINWLR